MRSEAPDHPPLPTFLFTQRCPSIDGSDVLGLARLALQTTVGDARRSALVCGRHCRHLQPGGRRTHGPPVRIPANRPAARPSPQSRLVVRSSFFLSLSAHFATLLLMRRGQAHAVSCISAGPSALAAAHAACSPLATGRRHESALAVEARS